MEVIRQDFHGLNGIIEELHRLFDEWEHQHALFSRLDADTAQFFRLVVHEWVANLVQHADFQDQDAQITLEVTPAGQRLRCVIEDNSEGFAFPEQIECQRRALSPFPERGMGLLLLNAATELLEYSTTHEGRCRLDFTVSSTADSCLDIPFSS